MAEDSHLRVMQAPGSQIVPMQQEAWGQSGGGDDGGAPLAIIDKGMEASGQRGPNQRQNDMVREQLISGVNRLKAELAIMGD